MNPPELTRKDAITLYKLLLRKRPLRLESLSLDGFAEEARPWLEYWVRDDAWRIDAQGVSFLRSEAVRLMGELEAQFDIGLYETVGEDVADPTPEPKPAKKKDPPTATSDALMEALGLLHVTPIDVPEGSHPWLVASAEAGINAMQHGARDRDAERKSLIERLAGPGKFYLPPVDPDRLETFEHLVERFPNFETVISAFVTDLSLAMVLEEPLHLTPTLLVGPPGIGKTLFLETISEVLGFSLTMRSMAEVSASFVLTGSHGTWRSSNIGLIAEMVMNTRPSFAPLFLLDELDKCSGSHQHPPTAPLLGILEGHTARRFMDEFLQLEMDIRPVSWMFTANTLETIPLPIRSRLRILHVEGPTRRQMPAVVRSVDEGIRNARPAMHYAFAPLSDAVIRHLEEMPPRQVGQVLSSGYARCARRLCGRHHQQREVLLSDLPGYKPRTQPPKAGPRLNS